MPSSGIELIRFLSNSTFSDVSRNLLVLRRFKVVHVSVYLFPGRAYIFTISKHLKSFKTNSRLMISVKSIHQRLTERTRTNHNLDICYRHTRDEEKWKKSYYVWRKEENASE